MHEYMLIKGLLEKYLAIVSDLKIQLSNQEMKMLYANNWLKVASYNYLCTASVVSVDQAYWLRRVALSQKTWV